MDNTIFLGVFVFVKNYFTEIEVLLKITEISVRFTEDNNLDVSPSHTEKESKVFLIPGFCFSFVSLPHFNYIFSKTHFR